ncbi:MAG: DUF2817 domain-containing protein [Pirellulaceae bacterium]|nr:DUF2817 domain-containing protein [Pirellulaceae bacterium]
MDPAAYFSQDYFEARDRFRNAAQRMHAELLQYPVPCDRDLTIDVAVLGDATAPHASVFSSGLHGVEGFFGSAVQLAWMQQLADDLNANGSRIVLLHAINPFGFANLRRWNEENVDLNRNFHINDDDYRGAPAAYKQFNGLLNPQSPPSHWEPFRAKAIATIARNGLQSVKQAIAGGQYEFPRGLFFGGQYASESTKIIQDNIDAWVGDASNAVHLDLHTGLGRSGEGKLLLERSVQAEWFESHFGHDVVEVTSDDRPTAYDSKGSLGGWLCQHFSDRDYRYALAEFGTHGVIRVLAALRAENRAHFYCQSGDDAYRRAKRELVECFCPASPRWRERVIRSGVAMLQQACQLSWT